MSEMSVEIKSSVNQRNPFPDKSGKGLTQEDVYQLPEVRRRVRALKKLQFQKLQVDGELEKVILEVIKSKFHQKYESIFEKRAEMISGSTEPTDEDCDFDLESQESESVLHVKDPKVDGIPGFWLKALQNFSLIRDWIFRPDEAVLYHLIDIGVTYNQNPSKFVIEFRFETNEFFTNDVLTKEYEIGFGVDPKALWETNPYYAVKRKGCQIDWKSGKNLLKKKKNSKNSVKSFDDMTSFFCFFEPQEQPKDKCEFDEELEDILSEDWQLGLIIIRTLVPNAVLCYTGDLVEDESESDSSDSSEEDSDSTSDDSKTRKKSH